MKSLKTLAAAPSALVVSHSSAAQSHATMRSYEAAYAISSSTVA